MNKPTTTHGQPLYPIREVSRLTGVNPVTLRAWERRYGLITPQRTPKGHRLYAESEIQRIQTVLQWLNRGVPVSQVRELLEQRNEPSPIPHEVEPSNTAQSEWSGLQERAFQAVTRLDEPTLDALFNEVLSVYPPTTADEHLWQPLLSALRQRWQDHLGAAIERQLFTTVLHTRISARLYQRRQHQSHHQPRLLMAPLGSPQGPAYWLQLLRIADIPMRLHWLDDAVPLPHLPLLAERLQPMGLVLVGETHLDAEQQRQLLKLTQHLPCGLALCGSSAVIHQTELNHVPISCWPELDMSLIEHWLKVADNA